MSEAVELTKKLVRINSVSGNEFEIADFVYEYLQSKGFKPEKQFVFDNRPNIVCTTGEGKNHVLFNSHMDTVNVCMGWSTHPFEPVEKDGRIYGLGSIDMKSGLAAQLEAFVNSDFEGRMTLAVVVDEEVYSAGTHHLLSHNRLGATAAIFAEPNFGTTYSVTNAVRGRYALNIQVKGKSAHGARKEGINAIVDAARLIGEIQNIKLKPHPVMGTGDMNIGSIRSGSEFLSVPELCEFRLDRHTVAGETMDTVKAEIRAAVAKSGIRSSVDIVPQERPTPFIPAGMTPVDSPIAKAAKAATEELGLKFQTSTKESVFDMGYTIQAGIPSICIGPMGGNIHGADEYVVTKTIDESVKIYKGILKNYE